MNESQWFESSESLSMLEFVQQRASKRKMILFACGCCRHAQIFNMGTSQMELCRDAIAVLERFADGLADARELNVLWTKLDAQGSFVLEFPNDHLMCAVCAALKSNIAYSVSQVLSSVKQYAYYKSFEGRFKTSPHLAKLNPRNYVSHEDLPFGITAKEQENSWQASLLRDLIGNPFQDLPPVDPSWLTRNDGTVQRLAEEIYEQRAFDRMPMLAEALQHAGCASHQILSHCRQNAEHARGCWVIDLLLTRI